MTDRDAAAAQSTTTLDSVGMACARASFVALLVGMVEGVVVARMADTQVSGIGLANAGVWLPAAFVALLPAFGLRRLGERNKRRNVAFVVVALLLGAILFAKLATHVPMPARVAPAEILAAIGAAWAASELEVHDAIRRPIALFGIVVALGLQLWATRWIDAHRAFAGLLADGTAIPRLLLKYVLHRFV